ncbi:TPA: hypothetical protein QDB14_001101 [Burkholderia vietnamiensis]|nr:hypothetical protein [Burkholderia vietnamiensis]
MKATILADGTLHISPESDLDAYALGQWSRVNLADWFNVAQRSMKITVDLSGYPGALDPIRVSHFSAGGGN